MTCVVESAAPRVEVRPTPVIRCRSGISRALSDPAVSPVCRLAPTSAARLAKTSEVTRRAPEPSTPVKAGSRDSGRVCWATSWIP